MSIEKLLNPRVRCTNIYPGCEFKQGQIINFTHKEVWFTEGLEWVSEQTKIDGGSAQFSIKKVDPKKYPANFEFILWWMDRKPEELECVTYLKTTLKKSHNVQVYKVAEWLYPRVKIFNSICHTFQMYIECYVPATELEYTEYLTL